jgi:hypothetical protein
VGLFFGAMSPTFAQRTEQEMTFAQRTDQRLNQTVTAYDSDKAGTLEQLVEAAQRFQISMGIEWADAHLWVPKGRSLRPYEHSPVRSRTLAFTKPGAYCLLPTQDKHTSGQSKKELTRKSARV